MSDTPRTNAAWNELNHNDATRYQMAIAMKIFAKQLERELAYARKQRDTLMEALRTASERFRNPKYGCMWDDAADDIDKTLAAVKGGSDE
jgi:hypothetical protein